MNRTFGAYRRTTPGARMASVTKTIDANPNSDILILNFDPKGEWNENTDLYSIHNYVQHMLKKNNEIRKAEIIPQLDEIAKNIDKVDTLIEYQTLLRKQDKLKQELQQCQDNTNLQEYNSRVASFLSDWTEENRQVGANNQLIKINIIRYYLHVVRNYNVGINMTFAPPRKGNVCPYCFKDYNMTEDSYSCEDCGIYGSELSNNITFDDMPTINNSCSHYNNKEVYDAVVKKYQGKQSPKWNLEAMKDGVKAYCERRNLNYMKLTPADIINIFDKLKTIHKEDKGAIEYNKHYEDANLFTHHLNGWPLPDIEQYETDLSDDYDMFYQVYEEVKDEERSSALNGQFVLLKLIQRREIPYRKENFKLPETDTIIISADNTARRVFKILEERRDPRKEPVPWTYRDTL